MHRGDAVGTLDSNRRPTQRGVRLAPLLSDHRRDVRWTAGPQGGRCHGAVNLLAGSLRLEPGQHRGCVVKHGRDGIERSRQRHPLRLDQGGCVCQALPIGADQGRDGLSYVEHAAPGQDGLRTLQVDLFEILGGHRGHHARHSPGAAEVDPPQERARVVAEDQLRIEGVLGNGVFGEA